MLDNGRCVMMMMMDRRLGGGRVVRLAQSRNKRPAARPATDRRQCRYRRCTRRSSPRRRSCALMTSTIYYYILDCSQMISCRFFAFFLFFRFGFRDRLINLLLFGRDEATPGDAKSFQEKKNKQRKTNDNKYKIFQEPLYSSVAFVFYSYDAPCTRDRKYWTYFPP